MAEEPKTLNVTILGEKHELPPSDCWLRAFQTVGFNSPDFFFHGGYYCWNNRCKTCIFTYIDGETGQSITAQSCLTPIKNGDQVIAVPENMGP